MERAELPPVFLCARYRHHRHMKSVLILYSGQSGHTRAMCDAAVAGAATQSADVTVRCLYAPDAGLDDLLWRSEEHTSELQSLMRISYAVFCLKKKQYTHSRRHKLRSGSVALPRLKEYTS